MPAFLTKAMVRIEESPSIHSPLFSPAPDSASPPPPPPPPQAPPVQQQAKPSPAAVLAQCLKLLKGDSDEHKFAGLVMVTKHVPALAASASGGTTQAGSGGGGNGQLRQICNAVGPSFLHRLLRTAGDSSGGGGGVGDVGLSVYQQIALGVLAAFFRDESLVRWNCRWLGGVEL